MSVLDNWVGAKLFIFYLLPPKSIHQFWVLVGVFNQCSSCTLRFSRRGLAIIISALREKAYLIAGKELLLIQKGL